MARIRDYSLESAVGPKGHILGQSYVRGLGRKAIEHFGSAFARAHAALHGFGTMEAYWLKTFGDAQEAGRTLSLDQATIALADTFDGTANLTAKDALTIANTTAVTKYFAQSTAGAFVYDLEFVVQFSGASETDAADAVVNLDVYGIEPNGVPMRIPLFGGRRNRVSLAPRSVRKHLGEDAPVGGFATANVRFVFSYANGAVGNVASITAYGYRGPVPEDVLSAFHRGIGKELGLETEADDTTEGVIGRAFSGQIAGAAGGVAAGVGEAIQKMIPKGQGKGQNR